MPRHQPPPYVVVLPFPPSLNRMWRSVPRRGVLLSLVGRLYRDHAVCLAAVVDHPGFGAARVVVRLDVFPPNRRKLDIDNRGKAVLDSLTHAAVWDDDEQVDGLLIVRRPIARPGGAVVVQVAELFLDLDPVIALHAMPEPATPSLPLTAPTSTDYRPRQRQCPKSP